MVLGQYGVVLVDIRWYRVSRRWYWLIHDGIESVWSTTCMYLVALDQCRAVMVYTWWYWFSMEWYWWYWLYWVSKRRYRLVLNGTGSVEGCTGWYMMILGQYGVILVVLDQYRAVMVDTWWHWFVLGGTRSVEGSKGRKYSGVRLKKSEIRQLWSLWAWW